MSSTVKMAHLYAALVAIEFLSQAGAARFAEYDHLFKQEHMTHCLSSTMPHKKGILPEKHALFVQVHLQ